MENVLRSALQPQSPPEHHVFAEEQARAAAQDAEVKQTPMAATAAGQAAVRAALMWRY